MPRWLSRSVRVGLLVLVAGSPAAAQEREFAVGGGYHIGALSWFEHPSTPTVDARYTRWGSGRWGFTTRVLVGLGGTWVDEPVVDERYRPIYVQLLARFRVSDSVTAAIGGGLWGVGERSAPEKFRSTLQQDLEGHSRYVWGGHLLAVELLNSHDLTDRLTLRVGAAAVVPIHINPTVLVVWKL